MSIVGQKDSAPRVCGALGGHESAYCQALPAGPHVRDVGHADPQERPTAFGGADRQVEYAQQDHHDAICEEQGRPECCPGKEDPDQNLHDHDDVVVLPESADDQHETGQGRQNGRVAVLQVGVHAVAAQQDHGDDLAAVHVGALQEAQADDGQADHGDVFVVDSGDGQNDHARQDGQGAAFDGELVFHVVPFQTRIGPFYAWVAYLCMSSGEKCSNKSI